MPAPSKSRTSASDDTSSPLPSKPSSTLQVAPPVVELVSRTRLFPEDHTSSGVHETPLSILDNFSVRFSLVHAAWYYDNPAGREGAFAPHSFLWSLRKTLNAYPQWAGQLQWIPYDPSSGQRIGRVSISYGSPTDPGIEVILARCTTPMAAHVADGQTRIKAGVWCADHFSTAQILLPTNIALWDFPVCEGRPGVSVQLTTFACGGVSIALRIAHALADATSLFQFVHDWAAIHRAVLDGCPLPVPAPIFDPRLLDKACLEAKDGAEPVRNVIHPVRSLPMATHSSHPGDTSPACSSMTSAPRGPGACTDLTARAPRMPWAEWRIVAPASAHYHICFTPTEIQEIWEAVSADTPARTRISRLDALLAFIWSLITRARSVPDADDSAPARMVVAIGVRARLVPRLSDAFLGSPILLSLISLPGSEVAASPGAGAAAIRNTVSQYTSEAIGAVLNMARQSNSQRFWRAFLGKRYTTVTSWVGLGGYKLDFGGGLPRYVDPVIPGIDGCIHVMEAGPSTAAVGSSARPGSGDRWYDEPVCLSLHLATEVMDRLLLDPQLRKYRDE
ncbi:uncharacterized protein TRAVEDRAFT_23629 [Trametes versicolor FP-101664 SS1]|uniref:uncharacterized protein n=1 Tax=Trametes versicolor (strain FP-101664) TaxID=717944 RepID=UPI0004622D8C|nr:uncharacterized protein TRAVEDRAFT_23629 [Trametes versicolor FP-101664 SS1]EIW53200.1 hypothetical protein TRAVEDRAFT_23629 [Trametes versicolor FP-101664 SS1]